VATAIGLMGYVAPQQQPDLASLAVTKVDSLRRGSTLATGSGILMRDRDPTRGDLFLITSAALLLDGLGHGIPDHTRFYLHTSASDVKKIRVVEYPLGTSTGTATWFRSQSVPEADIALVPVPPTAYGSSEVMALARSDLGRDVRIRPSLEVAILGFPGGVFDTVHSLPIWRTGYITSAREVMSTEGSFDVDSVSSALLAGAPVLVVVHGDYETSLGVLSQDHRRELIGIVSGVRNLRDHNLTSVWSAMTIGDEMSAFSASDWAHRVWGQIR
jgi:hypothetical protein